MKQMKNWRRNIIMILLAMTISSVFAQQDFSRNDSLHNVIINHVTDDEVMKSGISLIIKSVEKNDFAEGKNIEGYLLERYEETKIRKPGWKEQILLSFLADDFYTPLNAYQLKEAYWYAYSELYKNILLSKAKENAVQIRQKISNALLMKQEKEFLAILLDAIIGEYPVRNYSDFVDEYDIAQRAEHFLLQYPQEDVLTVFIRENYSRKYYKQREKALQKQNTRQMYNTKRRPYRFGCGIVLSLNHSFFDNELSSSFKTNVVGVTFDIDFSFHSFMLLTSVGSPNILFSTEKLSPNLDDEVKISSSFIDLSFGYNVFNHGYFRIIPFGGVSWGYVSLSEFLHEGSPVFDNIKNSFNPVAGLIFDYKLLKYIGGSWRAPQESFFSIRVKYSYHFLQFDKKYPELKGGMHQITVGIGFSGNGFKLKKNKDEKF